MSSLRLARSYSKVVLLAGVSLGTACDDGEGAISELRVATEKTSSALAAAPSWFTTAAMSAARGQHAAVLLPSGLLLVIGGVNSTGFNGSAELYDPATGTWSSAGNVGLTGNITQALLLPNGKVLVLTEKAAAGRLYDPVTSTWSASGAMAQPRMTPTVTLLATGKVLVAGGANGATRLKTAELYDPSTNTFTPTGSSAVAHSAHSAVLLANGKVLVISGFDQGGEVPSAELYNPVSGTWSTAAAPLVPRHYASATLLPDGRALFAGGFTAGGAITSAELYDAMANTWTATGSLNYVRSGHSTTLLPSGKVLVTGGAAFAAVPQKIAELYDPATGLWSPTSAMAVSRENHTATLLPSGKVFVTGGLNTGTSPVTFYASTELYDPAVNGWSAAGALATPRSRAIATLLPSGKVLVAGGRNGGGTTIATTELYDRTTNGWSSGAPLTTARERATVTLLPTTGKVLVAGGTSGNGATSFATTELYDPATNKWTAAASLGTARQLHSATLLDGKLLAVGGLQNATIIGTTELYDPTANTWTARAALATARSEHAAVRLRDGRVLVAGGRSAAGALASAELYNPATNAWLPAASLAHARLGLQLTLLPSGGVLASGGAVGASAVGASELYDPVANTWTDVGTLGQARWNHTASLMPSGEVLVAGGLRAGGNAETAEVYDPAIRAWRAVADPAAVGEVASATLPDGRVLIAGGTGATTAQLYDDTGTKVSSRPVVTKPDRVYAGCAVVVEGQHFRGIAGGGAGSYLDSPTDYPLVRLQSPKTGLSAFPSRDWSATGATFDLPLDFPVGFYSLTVLANAIGGGRMVSVAANAAPAAASKNVTGTTGVPLPIVVTATDAETDQPLTFTLVTAPTHGSLSGTLPSVTYTPTAGFHGADSFTFAARDCGTTSNVATVGITVVDPPLTIQCPLDTTLEATSAAGADGAWADAVATDGSAPAPTITYAPERGSAFPLGSTTVTATAQDSNGGTASCVFQLIVKDTMPPTVTCPANMTVPADGDDGALVSFDLPSATDTVSAPIVTTTPASGSRFPVGTTEVTVAAKDSANNIATCTFQVTVGAPPGTPTEDASTPSVDGGTPPPPSGGADTESPSADGCGCRVVGESPTRMPVSMGLALGLATLAGLRRRRRAS